MNVLPISRVLINYNNRCSSAKPVKNDCNNLNTTSLSNIYYPLSFQGLDFNYRPVSNKKSNYELLNCNYSDLAEFSNLYAKKINSQLKTIDLDDVSSLISRIKIKTGADEQLITDILYNLTLYSNYKTVDFIKNTVEELGAGSIGIYPTNCNEEKDISINVALNYFTNNKYFIPLVWTDKSMVILDGILLDELENSKQKGTDLYKKFITRLKEDSIVPVIFKGFDIECSDKKYRSNAFIYGSGNIEDIAIDTIKRIRGGRKLDDILYLDMEKRYKNLITGDVHRWKRKVEICSPEVKKYPNKYDVYENLKNPKMEPQNIKAIIDDYLFGLMEPIRSNLARYIDEFSVAYSFDTMVCELMQLYQSIKEKYGEDVIYTVLNPYKSELFLTHLYLKVNDIPFSKYIGCVDNPENRRILQDKSKTSFIIDDMSISGETIIRENKKVNEYTLHKISPNYALLLTTDKSIDKLHNSVCRKSDILCTRQTKSQKSKTKLISTIELNMLPICTGYKGNGCLIVFPHIIPDNCSDIASDLFKDLLIDDNKKSNKAGIVGIG